MIKQNIYIASDFHLGAPNTKQSHLREQQIVSWLNKIEKDAKSIYLVGDIFDFWFEYKTVVPKGFVRLLGKLAQLSDNGTIIHLFVGDHDLWMNNYLQEELGITIHHKPKIIKEQGKKILIGHGDGLGKGDYLYKFIRKIFTSRICQLAFSILHPNVAFSIAHAWSKRSRKNENPTFKNKEKKRLLNYCQKHQAINPIDYYVFGHTHIPIESNVDRKAKYINLGDWITHNTYAILKNGKLELQKYN